MSHNSRQAHAVKESVVSVHRGMLGPKGLLSFAPSFFKNKNPRKIRSATHQPLQSQRRHRLLRDFLPETVDFCPRPA